MMVRSGGREVCCMRFSIELTKFSRDGLLVNLKVALGTLGREECGMCQAAAPGFHFIIPIGEVSSPIRLCQDWYGVL